MLDPRYCGRYAAPVLTSASSDLDGVAAWIEEARLPSPRERRRLRLEAKMSLRDAARFLGTNATTVGRWESGKVVPRRAAAVRYRKLLDSLAEAVQ